MSAVRQVRADLPLLTNVKHEREARVRPLDFGIIRRLMSFTNAYRRTRTALVCLVLLRAVQLPALALPLKSGQHGNLGKFKIIT